MLVSNPIWFSACALRIETLLASLFLEPGNKVAGSMPKPVLVSRSLMLFQAGFNCQAVFSDPGVTKMSGSTSWASHYDIPRGKTQAELKGQEPKKGRRRVARSQLMVCQNAILP